LITPLFYAIIFSAIDISFASQIRCRFFQRLRAFIFDALRYATPLRHADAAI